MLVDSSARTGIGVFAPISVSRTITRGMTIRAEVLMVDERHLIIILSMELGAALSCKT